MINQHGGFDLSADRIVSAECAAIADPDDATVGRHTSTARTIRGSTRLRIRRMSGRVRTQ